MNHGGGLAKATELMTSTSNGALPTIKAFVRRFLARIGIFRVAAKTVAFAFGSRQRQNYVLSAPNPQNAIDIFAGQWWSRFPSELPVQTNGQYQTFSDEKLRWGLEKVGGVRNANVLELGPLEGGHTYMLHQAGASAIVAVEANTQSYLRCLVTKELLGLSRARFLCGDLELYLQQCSDRFDLVVAAGILYHLTDPLKALRAVSRITDRLLLPTHYYDEAVCRKMPEHGARFSGVIELVDGNLRVTAHRYQYLHALRSRRFMGGTRREGRWLRREDLFRILNELGFNDVQSAFDDQTHPMGPGIVIVARRVQNA